MSPRLHSGWRRARRQAKTRLVYLEDYGIDPAKLVTSGVASRIAMPR